MRGRGPIGVATVLGALMLLAALGGPFGGGGVAPLSASISAGADAPVPRVAASGRAVVWAVGDGADGGARARALAARIAAGRPARFLYLGDVYERGTAEEFATAYEPVYRGLAARTRPTPGNHEWGNRAEGYFPYWRAKRRGRALAPWYSFSLAGWQVVSLNSEAERGPDSAQLAWLRARVARPGTCRLAFLHKPRFSAGEGHGDNADLAPLWDALRGRARLLLAGHDHNSQRLRLADGITTLIAGAGGHSRYGVDEGDPRLAWGDASTEAALRLELRPGLARYRFVAADGRVLHRGSARCRPVAR